MKNQMKKINCSPFLLLLFLFSVSCQKKENTLEDTFKKSVEWMWAQQSEEGGWHSKTHAVLRDGRVLTSYILFYVLQVPPDIFRPESKAINNAVDFILKEMQSSMTAGNTNLVDYPNYSA